MKQFTASATATPLAAAPTPITDEERRDLEAFTGQAISLAEWSAIRQCLRCLTQGKCIDSGDGPDDKPFVRGCTAEELAARGGAMSGREAVRRVAGAWRQADGKISLVEIARQLVFSPAGLKSRAEWDTHWTDVEKARAARAARS